MKVRTLLLLALAELLAMALWFSASAVLPALRAEWDLSAAASAWLTVSVQLGFVAGALGIAVTGLADRWPPQRLIALCALLGAVANGAIPLFRTGPEGTLLLRFATGVFLAGVYPPGMKLVATWAKADRGLWIGTLVGALGIGSALPHLLGALPAGEDSPWQDVLYGASLLALLGALLVATTVRPGPYHNQAPRFDWHHAFAGFRDRATRLANFGYLGHMWELYSMWAWAPLMLLASYQQCGLSEQGARLAGFVTIGISLPGCILAGRLADRFGRTAITVASLLISGCCCLVAGFLFPHPVLLTALCLLWGFAVSADSAQFSAAVSELADPRYTGTALTMQTCLGFLLTTVTIQAVPPLVDALGWRWVFWVLALGPVFGIASMLRLRSLPEATKMAGGRR